MPQDLVYMPTSLGATLEEQHNTSKLTQKMVPWKGRGCETVSHLKVSKDLSLSGEAPEGVAIY